MSERLSSPAIPYSRPEPALDLFQETVNQLRARYPHGHPAFLPTTLKEIELHSAKNHDYAQGGPALEIGRASCRERV